MCRGNRKRRDIVLTSRDVGLAPAHAFYDRSSTYRELDMAFGSTHVSCPLQMLRPEKAQLCGSESMISARLYRLNRLSGKVSLLHFLTIQRLN